MTTPHSAPPPGTPSPSSNRRAPDGALEAPAPAARCLHVRPTLWLPALVPLALLTAGCSIAGDGQLPPAPDLAAAEAPLPSTASPQQPNAITARPADNAAAVVPAVANTLDAANALDAGSPSDAGAFTLPDDTKPTTADAVPAVAVVAEPPPCPDEMALVGRFCVDRYEAHLVADVGGVLSAHPYYKRLEPGVLYRARSEVGIFPQAYISRVEAKAACEASGKRLCSRNEWLRACKGSGAQTYPYGGKGKRGQCNTGKLHLLTEMFGRNPRGGFKYDEHFNSPDLNQTPGFLSHAGEYAGCASELNVFDMVGNLHEWVSDSVDQSFLDIMEAEEVERREQPWATGNGVFMGGFYSTTSELGPGCYYTTVAHEPRYHDYSTGFRCCAAARLPAVEPASVKKKKRPAG